MATAAPYAAPEDYPMELGGRYSLKITTAAEDAGAVQTWFDRASLLTPRSSRADTSHLLAVAQGA